MVRTYASYFGLTLTEGILVSERISFIFTSNVQRKILIDSLLCSIMIESSHRQTQSKIKKDMLKFHYYLFHYTNNLKKKRAEFFIQGTLNFYWLFIWYMLLPRNAKEKLPSGDQRNAVSHLTVNTSSIIISKKKRIITNSNWNSLRLFVCF